MCVCVCVCVCVGEGERKKRGGTERQIDYVVVFMEIGSSGS